MSGAWIRKGRVDPIPYIEKAKVARVPNGVYLCPFDVAKANGGKRTNKDSPPLPIHLQVQVPRRRETKRRYLDRLINPKPKPKNTGFASPFKVY